jgi:hypothetical protein
VSCSAKFWRLNLLAVLGDELRIVAKLGAVKSNSVAPRLSVGIDLEDVIG